MRLRVPVLAALALAAVTIAPTRSPANRPTDPSAEKGDDALRAKVRELEERLARVEKKIANPAPEAIPFGELTVNLVEDRLQRYLRVKISLQVDETAHGETSALVTKKRSQLRSWAIAYLAGLTLKEVSGSKGVAAVQEALKKGFGEILAPGGKKNPITSVLFEEYLIQ